MGEQEIYIPEKYERTERVVNLVSIRAANRKC
jgi:hypothetical protein